MRLTSGSVRHRAFGVLLLAGLAVGAGVASASTQAEATGGAILSTTGVLLAGILALRRPMARYSNHDYVSIELPVLLLLVSHYSWAQRDAQALVQGAADSAAIFQVVCTGLAGMIAFITLMGGSTPESAPRISLSIRIYSSYAVWVVVGATWSVLPALTMFHALSLAIAIAAVVGALKLRGEEAVARIFRLLYWFAAVLLASVWASVLLSPARAVTRVASPVPVQIVGVFPPIASNGVGTFASLLAVWTVSLLVTGGREYRVGRGTGIAVLAGSLVTLVAAQYRTGYVILLVGLALVALQRRPQLFVVLSVPVVVALLLWGSALAPQAESFALRGESIQQASQLSGRLDYWNEALGVWYESPLLGRGLYAASRIEVLPALGETEVATIHGTWVEALVGTGLVGLTLLALSFLAALRQALLKLRWQSDLVPVVLLSVILIRSITGTTIEDAGYLAILFLAVAALGVWGEAQGSVWGAPGGRDLSG